jgi:hypothetical protein
MKKLLQVIFLFFPLLCSAQAHLGQSLSGLKMEYPDRVFKIEYAEDGTKFTTAKHPLGTFLYYFDKETDLTFMCMQIPNDLQALNTQVEIYNRKYVIVSESSWKAYLDGGNTMKIKLIYSEELGTYYFVYLN